MSIVLVTGGAGYIGSHAVRQLAQAGYHPVTLDNLSEGHRLAVLEGDFIAGELSDEALLDTLFSDYKIDAIMHFASRCCVGESMENPQRYYSENVGNFLALARVMLRYGVSKFILSSTCATYGNPVRVPIDEAHPQDPVNPYGESKYFIERMLKHLDRAHGLGYVSLRYFNAAGAALDARVGESHSPETHLIARLLQVAKEGQGKVQVYGDDYPTPDGTCIRDYVHVVDLVSAHIRALEWLNEGRGSEAFNLGTGRGYSVREVVEQASAVTGKPIPMEVAPRREGDPPELVADARKANGLLGWKAEYSDLRTIIDTAWKWEQNRRY